LKVGDLVQKNRFYIMHLSYEGCEQERFWSFSQKNSLIGLSHPFVTEDWNANRDFNRKALSLTWVKQFDMFYNEMTTGDIVLILRGDDSLLGVAEIAEPAHMFDTSLSGTECLPFFEHVRKVKWLKTCPYDEALKLPAKVKGFVNVLSKVEPQTGRWNILESVDV
jgi:hypothetical protein